MPVSTRSSASVRTPLVQPHAQSSRRPSGVAVHPRMLTCLCGAVLLSAGVQMMHQSVQRVKMACQPLSAEQVQCTPLDGPSFPTSESAPLRAGLQLGTAAIATAAEHLPQSAAGTIMEVEQDHRWPFYPLGLMLCAGGSLLILSNFKEA